MIQFDDEDFAPTIPLEEDFEDQVRVAQEQLAQLREREEKLERQKRELEELLQRKDVFIRNRSRLCAELTRSVACLSREAEESQRRADQCLNARGSLDHARRTLESLRPEHWTRNQLKHELAQGLSILEEAEEELQGMAGLLASVRGGGAKLARPKLAQAFQAGQGFVDSFFHGLAFSLPAMIFLTVCGFLFLIFGGS